jgi:hypothetical protein
MPRPKKTEREQILSETRHSLLRAAIEAMVGPRLIESLRQPGSPKARSTTTSPASET